MVVMDVYDWSFSWMCLKVCYTIDEDMEYVFDLQGYIKCQMGWIVCCGHGGSLHAR